MTKRFVSHDDEASGTGLPEVVEAALNNTYGAPIEQLEADKLDKAEAADTYATHAQVETVASETLPPLVPPLVAQALAADDAPAQAAADAVQAFMASHSRATQAVDGLMAATDKALFDDVLPRPSNLFDVAKFTRGWIFDAGAATPRTSTTYGITPHIPLAAGQQYTQRYIVRATYFDAAGAYVGSHSAGAASETATGQTFTAPAGTASVRFSLQMVREGVAQVNYGGTLLPYEPGGPPRISTDYLPDLDAVAAPSADPDNLLVKGSDENLYLPPISPAATTFVEMSTNLIEAGKVTRGAGLDTTTGQPTTASTLSVSDWIPMQAGARFTVPNTNGEISRVFYYTPARQFISTTSFGPSVTRPTAPAGTGWVRFTIATLKIDTAQVNRGTEVLPFEPGHEGRIKKSLIPTEVPGMRRLRPILDCGPLEPYTAHITVPDLNSSISGTTVASVYAMWDALMAAHPGYVTRTHLGDVTHGQDTWPMYRYDLAPPEVPKTSTPLASAEHPAALHHIMVLTGIHGGERSPVWTMHRLAQAICEDWDSNATMEALRFNTHFTVIPVANPSGWTDGTRTNRNGIDLNRQFPTHWAEGTPGTETYGGSAPLTETEAQYIFGVLDGLKNKLVAAVDFHSFFGIEGTQEDFLWFPSPNSLSLRVATATIRRMERMWKKAHPDAFSPDPQVITAGAVATSGRGTFAYEAVQRGVPIAWTFEHCERLWVDGVPGPIRTSQVATMAYEAWTNIITLILTHWWNQ